MFNEYEGELNLAGCEECHPDGEAGTLTEELHVEVEALLAELGTLLVEAGIYNPEGTAGYAIKGTYTNTVAGAYWNFISIEEDRSLGDFVGIADAAQRHLRRQLIHQPLLLCSVRAG